MLDITNLTKRRLPKKIFENIARAVFLKLKIKKRPISLVFVSEPEIKKVNLQYRQKNCATDVLSFEGLDEILICPDFVEKVSKKTKKSLLSELTAILVHGILHLEGYDHEKNRREAEKMFALESEILKKIV